MASFRSASTAEGKPVDRGALHGSDHTVDLHPRLTSCAEHIVPYSMRFPAAFPAS